MYDKDLDFYTPLFVCGPFVGSDGYYFINKNTKLSMKQLHDIRKEWYEDEEFDDGFHVYLDKLFKDA